MKELIVFSAIVILAMTTLVYQADVNKMQLASAASNNLAQEIAFGIGFIENKEAIEDYAADAIKLGVASDYLSKLGASVQEFDVENSDDKISVTLTLGTEDFARIPFAKSLMLKVKGEFRK